MPKKQTQLAKLSRPRLYDAVPRERLFSLLDEKRKHPAIWVCGPPGAGKTTLVGTYLEARTLDGLWYQIDAGDQDVTSLFFYLSQAAASFPGKRKQLPKLAAEQLPNIAVFARRFFRALWEALPGNFAIVLDNFQDASSSPELVQLVDVLISEVPDSRHVLIISRNEPPPELSAQVAKQQLVQIGWEALRLTLDETAGILSTRGEREEAAIERIHARSGGWTAGVVLMREHGENGAKTAVSNQPESAIFDYLAAQIFDRQDDDTKRVMTHVAFLPFFTADMAAELSGSQNAGKIIERLYQGQIFTSRREGGEFQFHALLREFLASHALGSLAPEEIRQIRRRSAELMVQCGELEAAFELYRESDDLPGMRRLVASAAETLVKQGRWETLGGWLDALGTEDEVADPWLIFWRGIVEMATDALHARSTFERAYERFRASGNRTGELETVSRILDTYFLVWDTVSEMDPWIEIAEQLVRDDRPVSEQTFARAYSGLLISLLYRQPQNPLLRVGVEWVSKHYEGEADPTQRLRMAIFLLHFYDLMGEFSKADRVLAAFEPLLSSSDVSPLTQCAGWARRAQHYAMKGETEKSITSSERAINIAQEKALSGMLICFLTISLAHTKLAAGRFVQAEADLETARPLLNSAHRMIEIYFYWTEFWCVVLKDDRARQRTLWEPFGRLPPAGVAFNTAYNQPVIQYLVDNGAHDQARERIVRWRSALAGMRSPFIEFNMDLMEASVLLHTQKEAAALETLRRAFRTGAERGFLTTLAWVPAMMAPLCGLALAHGVEADYVTRLIRARGLSSPDPGLENWPWPVRIRALGRFTVECDGELLSFHGRPQHRTLELLKAIIAFGSVSVNVSQVTAALWSDSEGDAAHRAFAVALHRLRKLLGNDRAIRLSDGVLSLDRTVCWVDVLALEDRIAHAEALPPEEDPGVAARELLALYKGHLLGDEEAIPWILPQRERLRTQFLRIAKKLGDQFETLGAWDDASELYQRVIELDPLAEESYRRLMKVLNRRGRKAEAMDVYRRCRDMLSIILGVAPSQESQNLFRSMQASARPSGSDDRAAGHRNPGP